jgi:mRNA-degrading endonuclease RelE of RelBE toxin-antitoxin system
MTHSGLVVIIETPIFTRIIGSMLSDREYHRIQVGLVLRPAQGPLISGTHGLRKIRWGQPGRGKRGGIRLIYFWDPQNERIYMIFAYEKSRLSDLTPSQIKALGKIVKEELL